MSTDRYQICPCGSGKKFKFCCFETQRVLDQLSADELFQRAADFKIHGSYVNPDWQENGMAEILVVRQTPGLKYIFGAYLVDVFCLGLKNTFVSVTREYAEVCSVMNSFSEKLEEVSYEDVRSIVLGAIEYAGNLGFEPCEDWDLSRHIVEAERSFKKKFSFGFEGKPFYVQGADEDPVQVMQKLEPLFNEGKAHYLLAEDDESMDACDDDEEEESFDECLEAIEAGLNDGTVEDVQQEIQLLIDEFPERWEPLFLMATCLDKQGNVEQAIPIMEQVLEMHSSPETYFNLGGMYYSVFRFLEFLTCMEKSIELDGAEGEIGMQAKAEIDSFASVIRKTSGITLHQFRENAAHFEKAFSNLIEGCYEEAVRGFHLVLDTEPHHVQSHGNLGLAYASLGDRDGAIRHFDKAIALDPNYQPAIDNRRILLALKPGETLRSFNVRGIDFYGDKAKTGRSRLSRVATERIKIKAIQAES